MSIKGRKEKCGSTQKERLLFYSIPEPNTGCWLWLGGTMGLFGYGYHWSISEKKQMAAHRISYQEFVGPIPQGMDILHKCDTPACINPEHLRPGTHKENMHDCMSKGRNPWMLKKDFCHKGHPMSGPNLIIKNVKGKKKRHCRECTNSWQRNRGRI